MISEQWIIWRRKLFIFNDILFCWELGIGHGGIGHGGIGDWVLGD